MSIEKKSRKRTRRNSLNVTFMAQGSDGREYRAITQIPSSHFKWHSNEELGIHSIGTTTLNDEVVMADRHTGQATAFKRKDLQYALKCMSQSDDTCGLFSGISSRRS